MKNRLTEWWYNLTSGLRSLRYWVPIIWKDRDWDYWHIYNILKFKLEQNAKLLQNKQRFVNSTRSAEKMLLCARLIEIQQEELYAMEYMDYNETDFEFLPTNDELYELRINEISESYDEYFAKYPRQYKIALQECGADASKTKLAIVIGTQNQQRSKDLLYRIIQENIERWWD